MLQFLAALLVNVLEIALFGYLQRRSREHRAELPRIALVMRRMLWRRASRAEAVRRRLWKRAAQAVGLDELEERGGQLTGRAGSHRVRFEEWSSADQTGTLVVVSGPSREPPGVGLIFRLEEPGSKRRDPHEVEIGDEGFDQAVSVQGPPALARAVLDAATRRAVAGLVSGVMPVPGRASLRIAGELTESGELAVAAADALARTRDPAAEGQLLRALSAPSEPARVAGVRPRACRRGVLRGAAARGRGAWGRGASRRTPGDRRDPIASRGGSRRCPGQLSLAGGQAGQVSLAEDDAAGRLSLAEPREQAEGNGAAARVTHQPANRTSR